MEIWRWKSPHDVCCCRVYGTIESSMVYGSQKSNFTDEECQTKTNSRGTTQARERNNYMSASDDSSATAKKKRRATAIGYRPSREESGELVSCLYGVAHSLLYFFGGVWGVWGGPIKFRGVPG